MKDLIDGVKDTKISVSLPASPSAAVLESQNAFEAQVNRLLQHHPLPAVLLEGNGKTDREDTKEGKTDQGNSDGVIPNESSQHPLPSYSKVEIEIMTSQMRKEFAILDNENMLGQHALIRKSLAVQDIITSKRLPFSTSSLPPIFKPSSSSGKYRGRRRNASAKPQGGGGGGGGTGSGNGSQASTPLPTHRQSMKSNYSEHNSSLGNKSRPGSGNASPLPTHRHSMRSAGKSQNSSENASPLPTHRHSMRSAGKSQNSSENASPLPTHRHSMRSTGKSPNNSENVTPLPTHRHSMRSNYTEKLSIPSSSGRTSNAALLPEPIDAKRVDAKLQEVLELMNKAKDDINPSKLMFQAAVVFDELRMFDRAAYCYNKATIKSNAQRIVDMEIMPEDVKYKRKIERMSPLVLPKFLLDRSKRRNEEIYQESETQRLRKVEAHIQLVKLYLLTNVKDIYKAHDNLMEVFRHSTSEEEHIECLHRLHDIIMQYSALMKGKADFLSSKQVLRHSAGPIADDHLQILLDLIKVDPSNPSFHDWLGIRYAEKCDFPHSQYHYKVARDLRVNPQGQDWEDIAYSGENNQLLIEQRTAHLVQNIAQNVNKTMLKVYGSETEYSQHRLEQLEKEKAERDYAWFGGRHEDAEVIVYVPPPQGWG